MEINNIQRNGPQGHIRTHISKEDAELACREYKDTQSMSIFSPSLVDVAHKEMADLIKAYDEGRVEYILSPYELAKLKKSTSGEISETLDIDKAEVTIYSKKKISPPEIKDKSTKEIEVSAMDHESLLKEDPWGEINPHMRGVYFICGDLKIPCYDGFIEGRKINEEDPPLSYELFTPKSKNEEKEFEIKYPVEKAKKVLFVPLGAEITELKSDLNPLEIESPNENNFAGVWRLRGFPKDVVYKIRKSNDPSLNFISINSDLLPREEEKKYFQTTMPLPIKLEEEIKKNPKDLIHLVISYMGIKDKETGLTNFRYVCNKTFGEFLRKHKKYLPLIMNELKVGHCDLLSWYEAAQLRAHGKPAWVLPVRVTTKDGKHFNNAYAHSVVLTVDEKGKLIQHDPTVHVDYDKAYHPEVLKDELIKELDIEFSTAQTIGKKVKVLRAFKDLLPELRKTAEKNKTVNGYMTSLSSGFLEGLSIPDSEFNTKDNVLRGEVVSWDKLPSEINPQTVQNVLDTFCGNKNSLTFPECLETVQARKQFQWLVHALTKHAGYNLFYLDEKDDIETIVLNSAPDINYICEVYESYIPKFLLEKLPASTCIPYISNFFKTLDPNIISIDSNSYHRSDFNELDFSNESLQSIKEIMEHKYSKTFIELFKKGFILEFIELSSGVIDYSSI